MLAMVSPRWKARLLATPVRIRRWICAVHLGLIALLSLVPVWLFPPSVAQIPGVDKWAHGAMYGLLGALLRWAIGNGPLSPASRGLPLAAAGYGLLMEFLQLWFSGGTRMFSWNDAAANLVGAVVFWHGAGRVLEKRSPCRR